MLAYVMPFANRIQNMHNFKLFWEDSMISPICQSSSLLSAARGSSCPAAAHLPTAGLLGSRRVLRAQRGRG